MGADTITTIDRARPTALGGLGIVFTSVVSSIVAYAPLGETVRIRWTIGTYQHYGPEHAPTALVLTVFPVVLTGVYLAARGLRVYLERTQDIHDLDTFRTIYDICTLLVLATGIVSQLGFILLNL